MLCQLCHLLWQRDSLGTNYVAAELKYKAGHPDDTFYRYPGIQCCTTVHSGIIVSSQDTKLLHSRSPFQLMKHSIADTQSNELGALDFGRRSHGSGMSKPAQARALVSALTKESQRTGNRIFTTNELRTTAEQRCGIAPASVRVIIDALNDQGFLLKKGAGRYQLQTTDF